MKTKYYYMLMCLVMALSITALVSCGGSDRDDDYLDPEPPSFVSKGPVELAGHKIYIDMTYPQMINNKPASYQCIVEFTSKDYYQMYATNKWYEYDFVMDRYTLQTNTSSLASGSYTYDGTKICLSSGYVFTYVNGNWTCPDFTPTAEHPYVISFR